MKYNISKLRISQDSQLKAAIYMESPIVIPNCTTKIRDYCFENTKYSPEIYIPKSVRKIGTRIFYSTPRNRPIIYYSGTMEGWNLIEKDPRWNNLLNVKIICTDGVIE